MRRLSPRPRNLARLRPFTGAMAVAVAGLALLPAAGSAQDPACTSPLKLTRQASGAPVLQFGIYPGGGAGSVAGKADPAPEDPAARLAALQRLRGDAGLGVHLYTAYTGVREADRGSAVWMAGEIGRYTAAGFRVELVLRYRPAGGADARGFADAVRDAVRRYGADPGFTSLQVTNEANIAGAPDASDGAYAGAVDALVQGIVAGKDEVRRTGHAQVRLGFNWASDGRPAAGAGFWDAIARRGGAAFAGAVDWVGLDAYPGTWYPSLPLTSVLALFTGTALEDAVSRLRSCHMPLAGLGPRVAIHVSENGWPTGPGRSARIQAEVLEAMVRGVHRWRGTYNVSDYNWFDLRDSRTNDPTFESQYGLMRDDYSPKPAFGRYRDLIRELGSAGAATAPGCAPSPLRVGVARPKGWRVNAVRIRDGARTVRTLRPPLGRASRVSAVVRLSPGTRRLSFRLHGHRGGRAVTKLVRRSVRVCGAARS